jgi:hypothetical protein
MGSSPSASMRAVFNPEAYSSDFKNHLSFKVLLTQLTTGLRIVTILPLGHLADKLQILLII